MRLIAKTALHAREGMILPGVEFDRPVDQLDWYVSRGLAERVVPEYVEPVNQFTEQAKDTQSPVVQLTQAPPTRKRRR